MERALRRARGRWRGGRCNEHRYSMQSVRRMDRKKLATLLLMPLSRLARLEHLSVYYAGAAHEMITRLEHLSLCYAGAAYEMITQALRMK